mmetsp:Transcript_115297/g.333065  ORF Transcript_115297/g.333065 Transcript_115297/m.333065 type:complete len:252 (-) Transcript_115297:443-1198(-)
MGRQGAKSRQVVRQGVEASTLDHLLLRAQTHPEGPIWRLVTMAPDVLARSGGVLSPSSDRWRRFRPLEAIVQSHRDAIVCAEVLAVQVPLLDPEGETRDALTLEGLPAPRLVPEHVPTIAQVFLDEAVRRDRPQYPLAEVHLPSGVVLVRPDRGWRDARRAWARTLRIRELVLAVQHRVAFWQYDLFPLLRHDVAARGFPDRRWRRRRWRRWRRWRRRGRRRRLPIRNRGCGHSPRLLDGSCAERRRRSGC